ncbi:hypothetical protein GF420_01435 [candidate division GN15 bacterium]|nr:hypothetical protein [candidate division GN15 bacterium]
MSLRSRWALLIAVIALLAGAASAAPNPLIQTDKLSKAQIVEVGRMGLDIIEVSDERLKIVIWPGDLAELDAAGIGYEIVHDNLTEFYQSRYPSKDIETMGGFLTFAEMVDRMDSLSAQYPAICSEKFSIGLSIEGRNLWVLKVSDNHEVDEDEPEVFYNSLIHAREGAAGAANLRYLEWLLENYGVDPEVTDVVDNRELFFLLVYNPDGYVWNQVIAPSGGGMWRKNRRDNTGFSSEIGVDLNRNYGYNWGYDNNGSSPDPGDNTYRGAAPFSEPETQAVRDFAASREFVIVNNIHTYSNLVLWPWGYESGQYTEEEEFYRIIGDSLTQYNNYTPTVAWGLYPANGAADDWFWGDTLTKPRAISFTTEIGGSSDGFWPPLSRIPELAEENIFPNFFMAKIADNPYGLKPPIPPVAQVPDSSSGQFTVSWSHDDPVNPAVSYRLVEFSDKQTVTDDAEADYGYWDIADWVPSTVRAYSGTTSWATINENQTQHMMTLANPYLVQPNDTLRFRLWYDIELDWDYLYVQLSDDGGQSFVNLANDLTTNFDPNGNNQGNGITGDGGGSWIEATFDISGWAGQQVIVRLAYITDQAVLDAGVWVDDFENVDSFGIENTVATTLTDTSYSFSTHDAGEWWYRVTATDAEGQESAPSALVKTVIEQSFQLGDMNGDDEVDLGDVIYLVNALFLGGPAPVNADAADCTCDGNVDLNDVIALVNTLFLGGPPLSCP